MRIYPMIANAFIVVVLVLIGCWLTPGDAISSKPTFDCDKVQSNSIEEMICKDDGLASLDRALAEVYATALKKADNDHLRILKAEQRGWIKGRNDCWKSADVKKCIEEEYQLRSAELQARYRLVKGNGPFYYACDGNPKNEVIATFFVTDPPTLIAEYGDQVSLMYLQPSASGAKYHGRNESLWDKGEETLITWGFGSPVMRCIKSSKAFRSTSK